MMDHRRGKIILLTAPSGSGKTTLARYLLDVMGHLAFSVSATTRAPRSGECDGKDYHFKTQREFAEGIRQGAFFEYQEVYPGQFYGTLNAGLEDIWAAGKTPLLDVDVKGALNIESGAKNQTLSLFIKAPGLEVLRKRLEERGTDSPEAIERRLAKAEEELSYAHHFDYVITNDRLYLTKELLRMIVADFLT